MSAPDLGALISARLCHDLISPMGAIGNGLELLGMSAGAGSAEIGLISESLGNALARLRFYRIAFGPADADARIGLDEVTEITGAMFSGRLGVAWEFDDHDIPRRIAQLAGLAILCLEKSLPMGGLVRVSMAEDTVTLKVEGRRTAPPPALWAHVTDGAPIDDLRPDAVQFALLRQALAQSGHTIEVALGEDAMALRLSALSHQPA